MKLALLLNVVDPNIGGVLIMGDRGTGKSVAVRSLVDLLPQIDVVVDDPFNSHPTDPKLMGPEALLQFRSGKPLPATKARTPLVELPLGATEDRICGTIDIEKALSEGIKVRGAKNLGFAAVPLTHPTAVLPRGCVHLPRLGVLGQQG